MRRLLSYKKMKRRGIKKDFSRFMAILCIVALGTGFLSGLLATTPDMKESANKYYSYSHLYDFYIRSNLGLKKRDLRAAKNLSFVKEGVLFYERDLLLTDEKGEKVETRITYIKDGETKLNRPQVIKGRMPGKSGEAFACNVNPYTYKIKIGDVYKTERGNRIKLVGIGRLPHHISTVGEFTKVGGGNVRLALYVPEHKNRRVFTTMYLETVKTGKEADGFSKEYEKTVLNESKKLEQLGKKYSRKRRREIVNRAQKKLDSKKASLKKEEDRAAEELSAGKKRIDINRGKILSAKKNIKDKRKEVLTRKKQILDKERILSAQKNDIRKIERKINADIKVSDSMKKKVKEYHRSLKKIDTGKLGIKRGLNLLNERERSLKLAENRLKIKENEYYTQRIKAKKKFREANLKLQKVQNHIYAIKEGKWYIQDRMENVGISRFKDDVEKVGAIAKVFPVFFFLIAALVSLTTMTRIIEEDRGQIGILKSLGYSSRHIDRYYLSYGLRGGILGCLLGEGLGFIIFPKVISNAYIMMYQLPETEVKIRWDIAIGVMLITLGCIAVTVLSACRSEIKEKTASLLLPKAPKAGKRIFLEKIRPLWKRLRFSQKVTLRNLFRYKKRFFMTTMGVAGCFALLLTGFGVRDAIGDIVEIQYDEIYHYDFKITMAEGKDSRIHWDKDYKGVRDYIAAYTDEVFLYKGKEKQQMSLIVPEEKEKFKDYIKMRDRERGKNYKLTDKGAVLTEKACEVLNIKRGDRVLIKLAGGKNARIRVEDICENYTNNNIYISPEYYSRLTKIKPEFNTVYGKKNNKFFKDKEIISYLSSKDEIAFVMDSATVKSTFKDSVRNIDYIVLVLIISAGALAGIVLYNLINVNICERKRELATIEVLGFFQKEIFAYIFREIYILTLIGIGFGIPVGRALNRFVVGTAEVGGIMFGRSIYWRSYIYAVIITLFFTFVINLIMRRVIKSIDMVESMKAAD